MMNVESLQTHPISVMLQSVLLMADNAQVDYILR